MRQSVILSETQDIPGAHTQKPSKVHPRSGPTCRRRICSPTGTPKIKNGAKGSSLPSQDTGLPQAFPCISHTDRQAPLVAWLPGGLHGQTPKHTWIWAVARGLDAPIAPTPTSGSNVGVYIFYREGMQVKPTA